MKNFMLTKIVLMVIVALMLTMALVFYTAPDGSASSQVTPAAQATKPRELINPGKGIRPNVGAVISPNSEYTPAICMDTAAGMDEAFKWINRRDMGELARTMIQHGGQLVEASDKIKILQTGIVKTKVRVIRTRRECYVASEVVRG